jgi:hypothetical protein
MSRIAHFHSLSSAETIKRRAKKEGRQEIFTCFTWLKNSMLLIRRRSNRKFFLQPLAAPSYPPGALGVRPPVPAPLAAKSQVPLQRLPPDKLETSRACRIPNPIAATFSRQAVSSLRRICLEFVGDDSSRSQTNSRRLEFDVSLSRV